MKRFIGLFLTLGGGAATIWGGYHALIGETSMRINITPDISVSAMAMGLVGIAVATVGVVWLRD
jgi:hypothetical protein